MAEAELIDLGATRRANTKIAANLATALEEADHQESALRCMLAQARAAALMGFDAEDEIQSARENLKQLSGQLAFAEALAHRARKRRA